MIRINLLPFRVARQRENIRRQVSIFTLLIILLILGLSYHNTIILDNEIRNVKSEIARVDNTIAIYKKKLKELPR